MQSLSQKLTSLRKSKNLTQQQLAKEVNYSDKVISKWERGESVPDVNALHSIAKFYNISLDELMESCSTLKINEKHTQLKKIGKLFHVLLTCVSIMFLIFYACSFNYVFNSIIVIHNASSIIALVLLIVLNVFNIIDLIWCHLKIDRMWASYVSFGVICTSILLLIVSCFLYGTAVVLSSVGIYEIIGCILISIVSIAYGYIFYRKT